jgi:hypothetical protein
MKSPRPWFVFAIVLTLGSEAHSQRAPSSGSIEAARRDGSSLAITGDPVSGEVPEFHPVARGDTLWAISESYLGSPWRWPEVWGLNPQVTNPHWIFPGDRVRLLREATPRQPRPAAVAPGGALIPRSVTPSTVFHLSEGFLDAAEEDSAGTIVGSVLDHMLLTADDDAFVEFSRRVPRVGEVFAIYASAQEGAGDRATGHVVRVLGSLRITRWDERRRIATGRIIEALDTIERGERVAVIPRTVRAVPPVRNSVDLTGHIAATVYPRAFAGQNQIVFLDRGSEDRVALGNRFLVTRTGDAWRESLEAMSADTASGVGLDRDGDGLPDAPPDRARRPSGELPEQIVGELLVVEVRARTCTAIVTSSTVPLVIGDRASLRRGY